VTSPASGTDSAADLRRAVDQIAAANGVTITVTHLVYSYHHAGHAGASSLFDGDVIRVGHEETRRLLLRDGDPARARAGHHLRRPLHPARGRPRGGIARDNC
jgi:hypothetical protein